MGRRQPFKKQKFSVGNPTDPSAGNPTDATPMGGETPPMAQCGKPHHYLDFPWEGAQAPLAAASPVTVPPVKPTARRSSRMDAGLVKAYGDEAALAEARAIHSRSDDQSPTTTPTPCPDEPRRPADDGEAAPPDHHDLIEAWRVYGVEPEGPSWVTPMLPEVMLPLPLNDDPLWLGGFVDHVYQITRPSRLPLAA
jgi:hypothetical protein